MQKFIYLGNAIKQKDNMANMGYLLRPDYTTPFSTPSAENDTSHWWILTL